MNLCLSISYASTNRPADSMFYARFIEDRLLKEIYETTYPFIKSNDSAINLVKLLVCIYILID